MALPWLNPKWRPAAGSKPTIVFVHGAVVNGWETALLRHRLRQLGYHVRLFQYQSMLKGLDKNVDRLAAFIESTKEDTLHLVGHSMGGVLIRHVFERNPDPRPGRLIAIGSPFLDCWIGRRFLRVHPWVGKHLIGRTVFDHVTQPRDPVWRGARDFGVIAGTYPFGIGAIFRSLPKPSDGVVLLEETRLGGISDHVTYRLNHFGMLFSKRCCAQIARFLACGSFAHVTSAPSGTEGEQLPEAVTSVG
jgi:pimeloyl-ACP methyl ester carboxylesterase